MNGKCQESSYSFVGVFFQKSIVVTPTHAKMAGLVKNKEVHTIAHALLSFKEKTVKYVRIVHFMANYHVRRSLKGSNGNWNFGTFSPGIAKKDNRIWNGIWKIRETIS